jgi:hypothetical protein
MVLAGADRAIRRQRAPNTASIVSTRERRGSRDPGELKGPPARKRLRLASVPRIREAHGRSSHSLAAFHRLPPVLALSAACVPGPPRRFAEGGPAWPAGGPSGRVCARHAGRRRQMPRLCGSSGLWTLAGDALTVGSTNLHPLGIAREHRGFRHCANTVQTRERDVRRPLRRPIFVATSLRRACRSGG